MPTGRTQRVLFLFAAWVALFSLFPALLCAAGEQTHVHRTCDLQHGPCEHTDGELRIVLEVGPRPIRAMRELQFTVTVNRRGEAFDGASVLLDLSMPGMFMGVNRPKLSGRGSGVYAGTGIVPQCPSGRKLWKVNVDVSGSGRRVPAEFLFEVQ